MAKTRNASLLTVFQQMTLPSNLLYWFCSILFGNLRLDQEVVYDLTIRFCDKYIDRFSRMQTNTQHRIQARDFCFTGNLGSAGTHIEETGPNRFAVTLGAAPRHPEWANKLNFEINRPARDVELTLQVSFENGARPSFNQYPQAYAVDGAEWVPVDWKHGTRVSTITDELQLPRLSWNRLVVGTQIPVSHEHMMEKIADWTRSSFAERVVLGTTAGGRELVRMTISDARGRAAGARGVHYITHQHPGEFNAQWRIFGMIDWLLSDDSAAAEARRNQIFHFVPCMSPDGPAHGWYRVNADGQDMNRTYRIEGADAASQTAEAFWVQRDFEQCMRSADPVTGTWAMHTWQGIVEPILWPGPEFGGPLGNWEHLREIIMRHDAQGLIKPLKCRTPDDRRNVKPGSWGSSPHLHFGITNVLCEGGSHFDRRRNELSGAVLARSISEFYAGHPKT